jgi:hypothetical protein
MTASILGRQKPNDRVLHSLKSQQNGWLAYRQQRWSMTVYSRRLVPGP